MRAASLTLLLTGCTFGWDLSRLSATDLQATEEAIQEYEELGCDFTSIIPGRTIVVYYEDIDRSRHHVGLWSPEAASIYIDASFGFRHDDEMDEPCSDSFDFHQVMLHEIGHVAGFGHVSDRTAIMYPVMPTCSTRRTIEGNEREAMQIACLSRRI